MTSTRFDFSGAAGPERPGEHQGTESWERSGSWEQAEPWDYDEARATASHERLELQISRDQEEHPRFDRFEAAVADTLPLLPDPQVRSRARPLGLGTTRTGRLWATALWLVGAAAAGVLAGMVSTNLLALAMHSEASGLVAAPSVTAQAAHLAPAPSSVPVPAQAPMRPAAGGNDHAAPAAFAPPAPAEAPPDAATAPASPPPPAAAEARVTTPLAPVAAPPAEYRVQLALLRDPQNVGSVWQDFTARFGPAAKELHRYVVPIRTARGTRHLVQVGPFADETRARAMCSKLRQRGGDCLVFRQPS